MGNQAGSAYVYDLAGGTPTVPVDTLNKPSPAASDFFGSSVAISGTRVVVGAGSDDTGAVNAGSAYVYDLATDTPSVPVTILNNPSPEPNDIFGHAVAIDGTTIAIGTPWDDSVAIDKGFAYIYGPAVLTIHAVGADFRATFPGTPGNSYRVQYTTSTVAPYAWNEFMPPAAYTAGPNGAFTHTDVNPPNPVRFYRAIASP